MFLSVTLKFPKISLKHLEQGLHLSKRQLSIKNFMLGKPKRKGSYTWTFKSED